MSSQQVAAGWLPVFASHKEGKKSATKMKLLEGEENEFSLGKKQSTRYMMDIKINMNIVMVRSRILLCVITAHTTSERAEEAAKIRAFSSPARKFRILNFTFSSSAISANKQTIQTTFVAFCWLVKSLTWIATTCVCSAANGH